jgi:LuxR family maltose regulon positive regulatory protein
MADMPDRSPEQAIDRPRLLVTKRRLPQPPPGFVARPRLLHRLDEGLAGELTLVCAPAGFDKTSLLARLEPTRRPSRGMVVARHW